jgi:hypothetical protein
MILSTLRIINYPIFQAFAKVANVVTSTRPFNDDFINERSLGKSLLFDHSMFVRRSLCIHGTLPEHAEGIEKPCSVACLSKKLFDNMFAI